MATAGRDTRAAPAGDVAARLREAGFVRLVSAADGDGLAATGTIAGALAATATPYQASVATPFAETARETDADLTVAVGRDDATADLTIGGVESASATAFDVAGELGASPDPTLALAGTIAADSVDETIADAAERAGVDRRPGVAVPTEGLADGLAHSTLVHAPFSGSVEDAGAALSDLGLAEDAAQSGLDEDDRRRVASLVALEATDGDDGTSGGDATERAAVAVERALRPYAGGPFETVGGYADVLDATARERPGAGTRLVLGDESAVEDSLDAWRTHGKRAHEGLRACDVARYDGLVVARGPSMPVATVARLLADFRSAEPVVLVVTDDEAAVHATDGADGADEATGTDVDVASTLDAAASSTDGELAGSSTGSQARARFDGDADEFVAAFREAR